MKQKRLIGNRKRRLTNLWKTALSCAVLFVALVCALGGCASTEESLVFDSRFVEELKLTEDAQKELKDSLREVNAEVEQDGFLLRIGQTLGNRAILYVALDVTLPAELSLADYISTDEHGEHLNLHLNRANLHRSVIDYDEITNMTYYEFLAASLGYQLHTGSGIQETAYDLEENRISYLLYFDGKWSDYTGEEVSLLIEAISFWEYKGEEEREDEVLGGPFVLNWLPDNEGEVYDWEILDENGVLQMRASLSGFHLQAEVFYSDYATTDDFWHDIAFVMKDGETVNVSGGSSGGGSSSSGNYSLNRTFREYMDLSEVAALQVGQWELILE